MLRGDIIGLRAQQDSDIEVFVAELLNDVETRMRSDSRPWRPVAPGSADSPYRRPASGDDHGDAVKFSAVELATGELAGEALLWGIDLHNRNAHLGLSLRPTFISRSSPPEYASPGRVPRSGQAGRRASSLRATRAMTAASTTENPSSAVRALNAWVARPRPSTGTASPR